jgi:hypothetical protein
MPDDSKPCCRQTNKQARATSLTGGRGDGDRQDSETAEAAAHDLGMDHFGVDAAAIREFFTSSPFRCKGGALSQWP